MTMGRRLRSRSVTVITLAAAGVMLSSANASAHRRDELLQAARIDIDSQWVDVQVSLTPGMMIADGFIKGLDRDADGVLSDDEKAAFLGDVLAAMTVRIDGQTIPIHIESSSFPSIEELRSGDASIDFLCGAAVPRSAGKHRVAFINAYRRDIGVYLVNALTPVDPKVTIGTQQRDPDQQSTTIDYSIASNGFVTLLMWVVAPATTAWLFARRRLLVLG